MKEFWLRTNNAVPKFRAWNKHTKSFEQKVVHLEFIPFAEEWAFNDPDLILQFFTGCKDVNGQEIYEGDIVSYNYGFGTYIVTYRRYDASFVLEDDDREEVLNLVLSGHTFYEVIGNVHENSKLLEEE